MTNQTTEDILKGITQIIKNSEVDSLYNEILSYIHITIVSLITLHLVYFIYMLVRKNIRSQTPKQKYNESCIICLEDIQDEVQLICSHSFCGKCIISYYKQRHEFYNLECPICRKVSKLLFANFERTEENKTNYDEIVNYNYDLTSKSTWVLSIDLFKLSNFYFRHVADFSNRRYDRHRKGVVVFILMVFLCIIYPLTYELEFEIVEDVIFYLSLVVFLGEFFYRTIRENVNREYVAFNVNRFNNDGELNTAV
jgi:hypothetical protein